MSFYLLKGTLFKEDTSNIIIKEDHISSILGSKIINKEEFYFELIINMVNGDECRAFFNTEEEIKDTMIYLGVKESEVDNFILQEIKCIDNFRKFLKDKY